MKRNFGNDFERKNGTEYEQLSIDDALLQPRRPQKLSAERTVSEQMRSEYASSLTVSDAVATETADVPSAIKATDEPQNVACDVLNIAECDDAFSLDNTQTELIAGLQMCEDCTNCTDFNECFSRKGE